MIFFFFENWRPGWYKIKVGQTDCIILSNRFPLSTCFLTVAVLKTNLPSHQNILQHKAGVILVFTVNKSYKKANKQLNVLVNVSHCNMSLTKLHWEIICLVHFLFQSFHWICWQQTVKIKSSTTCRILEKLIFSQIHCPSFFVAFSACLLLHLFPVHPVCPC